MSETLPRWNLPAVNFLETDPSVVEADILTGYEKASGRTLAEGDPVRLFLLSVADVIIQLRSNINRAAQQNLLSYAQGEYLDALGTYLSVDRLQASPAVTTIQFRLAEALANAFTIPKGFEVTNGIVTFATDEDLVIPSGELTGEVIASCTEVGEAGNGYLAGQLTTIVTPKTFLASATNTSVTTGGADIESDAEFAERIRMAPNSFSVAGPEKAYVYHASTVSSAIIDVKATSPEPGVVNVYALMEGGELPSDELLSQIEAHLRADTLRPLTDFVEALAPVKKEFTINVDYWIAAEDKTKSIAIQAAVEEAVQNYRTWQQTKIGRDISPARLIHNVIAAGAARIDESTLQPGGFQAVGDYEVAQCVGVTVNYKGFKEG